MNPDDLLLLQRWRMNDRTAGDALIRRHYAFAYRMARKLLGGDHDGAQEVSQRAFETLLHKRDAIETNVRGYLRRVVMLKVLSFRRKQRDDGHVSELEAEDRGIDSQVGRRKEIKLMVRALRSLSLEDQLLLAWAYGDERSQREIAESLGMALAQCNTKLHRARQRLKGQLEELRDSPAHVSTLGGFETWLASVHGRRA